MLFVCQRPETRICAFFPSFSALSILLFFDCVMFFYVFLFVRFIPFGQVTLLLLLLFHSRAFLLFLTPDVRVLSARLAAIQRPSGGRIRERGKCAARRVRFSLPSPAWVRECKPQGQGPIRCWELMRRREGVNVKFSKRNTPIANGTGWNVCVCVCV